MSDRQLCTFYVAGEAYALAVERIQEVLRQQELTVVPLAPPAVKGLINLRGEIVTAVDLRVQLELPPRPPGAEAMNVVLRADGEVVSLLVDEIGDVVEVDAAAFEAPPDTLSPRARALVRAVCKLPDQLLLVLDAARAAEVTA